LAAVWLLTSVASLGGGCATNGIRAFGPRAGRGSMVLSSMAEISQRHCLQSGRGPFTTRLSSPISTPSPFSTPAALTLRPEDGLAASDSGGAVRKWA